MIAGILALFCLMAAYYKVRIKPGQQAAAIDKQFTGLSAPARRRQPTSLRPGNP
jgi:hypothetical protein